MELPEAMEIRLEVLDALGRQVAILLNTETLDVGTHSLRFSAAAWPPGLYLLQIRANNGVVYSQKLIKTHQQP